jgi:hypothetical protein
VGSEREDTVMASSSNLGGAMRAVFKETKRSQIKARARTEQAMRGQMGQPAACMMDSNSLSARMKSVGNYGPGGWRFEVTNRYEKSLLSVH